MKQFYKFFTLFAVFAFLVQNANAATWSYDWPKSATADKPEYAGGFYNFGTNYDAELTSMTKTLNRRAWTMTFDKGTKLAYLAGSGQSVGSSGAFTSQFGLLSNAFSGKITKIAVTARTKASDAKFGVTVNGKAYLCNGVADVAYTNATTTPEEYVFIPGADGAQEGEIAMSFSIPGATKNAYLKQIVVEYEEVASAVKAPTFAPAAGTYDEPVSVTLSADAGATILYTLDGSNPRTEGNAAVKTYSAPFEIAETTVVNAVAEVEGEMSAVAEAKYVIRKSPGLSIYGAQEFTIELLEEGSIIVDNPNNVEPITYKSSNPQVAYADKTGHIYTYAVGEAVISVKYAGDDVYLPQELLVPVKVIAKEPLAGLTVTPAGGTYNDLTEVTIQCTDVRAKALWYYIGDKAMTLDELGILNEFEIIKSTSMTLKLDHSCVLSVQAMGDNVWSEPQFVTYTINMPLRANFEAGEAYETVYGNGFDTDADFKEWEVSTGSEWKLAASCNAYPNLPEFSSINPNSKNSLYHKYASTGETVVISSPAVSVPEGGKVQFYSAFNPIWIFNGNVILYATEDVPNAVPVKIWDAFLASQEAASDDVKWNKYSADLKDFVGKKVRFSFSYVLDGGDDVFIDDFKVTVPKTGVESVTVTAGEKLQFKDLSTGEPTAWEWQFPGADQPTSKEQNPAVSYSKAGTYDVKLKVIKGTETAEVTRKGYVVVQNVAPTAEIGTPEGVYYSPEAGLVVPLNIPITFKDASKGFPTAYEWSLPGTDLLTSKEKDVTVKYLKEGMFDVDLAVSNNAGRATTYIYGVKAGGESLVWNIAAKDNANLGMIELGWYGCYGGTNWLDMDAFAECFEKPASPVNISSVNIYFASVATAGTPDAEITVSIAKADAKGMPGEVLATSKLPVSQLVDASQTYNDPTTFVLDKTVKLAEKFFVTVSGFPNGDGDNVVMFALRRQAGEKGTTYHYMKEYDDNNQPTGVSNWYVQNEDVCSFAIAPKIVFDTPQGSVAEIEVEESEGPVTYYNLQGIRINADRLIPGIYIRQQGKTAKKVIITE